jgi:Heme oxygenase.
MTFRRFFATLGAAAALMTLQTAAHAHFIWATVENGQARFALLDDTNTAPDAKFEKYVSSLSPRCDGKAIPAGTLKGGARYAPLTSGQKVVVAESTVGAREREGAPYLLIYQAKGAASLDAAATRLEGAADIIARRDGQSLVVSVYQDGWAVPYGEVWVHWPGVEAPTSVKTDTKGEARAPWPAKISDGFVGIRAMVEEPKSGEQDGIKYKKAHRWVTLTFPVAAAAAPAPVATSGEQTTAQILRAAYGNNHDIVSNAAFNKTLFEGKLTRRQVEIHLQQRALIHNECHRILNAAPAGAVPYGPAQKQLLAYLFDDLLAMGSGWPTEVQARPRTLAFLQEIRASEAKGPYFALGVHHVYYGGTTNGGRMIGQKIADTNGINLDYYLKTDGYQEYLAGVNKITDPAAREEMIRGGVAAYKYIIDSMNEDVFKTDVAKN